MFCPKFRNFCFFAKLCNKANLRVMISIMTIFFSSSRPKYPNKRYLVANLDILFLRKNLQLNNFESTSFKYDNSFFKIQHVYTNIPKYSIFSPKFRYFRFFTKIGNQKNSRVLISNITILFSTSSLKLPKSAIFLPNFSEFCFALNLALRLI